MKAIWWLVVAAVLAGGCARSTVETRKKERYGAYASLPEQERQLVDEGKIKVGMTLDAVYIAWGKPDQVFSSETAEGATVSWLYHDTHLESYHYWAYRSLPSRHSYRTEPYLAQDYYVRPYVSAEVVFQNGVVREWRTLPYPVY